MALEPGLVPRLFEGRLGGLHMRLVCSLGCLKDVSRQVCME